MKSLKPIILILVFALFTSCASKKQKEQTISISGAFALYPLVIKWAEEYKKENPEVRFNISGGGAGKGMADALSGTVDLGMFSREIAPSEIDKGVWWAGLTIDAVLPTISAKNPYLEKLKKRGVNREELSKIYIKGSISDWSKLLTEEKAAELNVYTRSDACGAAGTWAKYLGGSQEDLQGIGIYGDPGLAEAVCKDPLGIAFNNTIFIYDIESTKKRPGIEVIPIDLNENGQIDDDENFYDTFDEILSAIARGVYPSPPARELYFVSDGKPEKQAALDFIKWCLTSGQRHIKEAGYVPISQEKIDAYLEKL